MSNEFHTKVDSSNVKLEQFKDSINKSLHDSSKPWSKGFEFLEQKTGVNRVKLFSGAALFCAVYLIFGCGAQLLCNFIGVLYPAYVSIHAIESSTKVDDTKWLTYWVTFGFLSVIEFFSGIVTSIIPFYWLLKCVFLIWCMSPMEKNGSYTIYTKVIRPYFLKHHEAADKFLDDAVHKVKSSLKDD